MGKLSRTKGRAFEQKIARVFRAAWPDAVVRRSSQADRAYNPDVMIEHGPAMLQSLWLELNDARNPDPLAKLAQAERDVDAMRVAYGSRSPAVIWHRLASRSIHVTMRACVFDALRGIGPYAGEPLDRTPITMSLDDFIGVLKRAAP